MSNPHWVHNCPASSPQPNSVMNHTPFCPYCGTKAPKPVTLASIIDDATNNLIDHWDQLGTPDVANIIRDAILAASRLERP